MDLLDTLDDDDEDRLEALAGTLEDAARTRAAVRYGTAFRFGAAHVVLNPDDPLPSAGFASGLAGDPGLVETTLRALPQVFAEAGRACAVVLSSPSSAPELELLAEETGYEAVEESAVLLLTAPDRLVEAEPGILTRLLPERDEHLVAPLLAEAHGWSPAVGRRLQRSVGHRLDDPRTVAFAAYEGEDLVGVATGFSHGGLGQLVHVGVREDARRRSRGRALASAVAATLVVRGARLVWATVEARSRAERFAAGLGFEPAYDTVTYLRPVDDVE